MLHLSGIHDILIFITATQIRHIKKKTQVAIARADGDISLSFQECDHIGTKDGLTVDVGSQSSESSWKIDTRLKTDSTEAQCQV